MQFTITFVVAGFLAFASTNMIGEAEARMTSKRVSTHHKQQMRQLGDYASGGSGLPSLGGLGQPPLGPLSSIVSPTSRISSPLGGSSPGGPLPFPIPGVGEGPLAGGSGPDFAKYLRGSPLSGGASGPFGGGLNHLPAPFGGSASPFPIPSIPGGAITSPTEHNSLGSLPPLGNYLQGSHLPAPLGGSASPFTSIPGGAITSPTEHNALGSLPSLGNYLQGAHLPAPFGGASGLLPIPAGGPSGSSTPGSFPAPLAPAITSPTEHAAVGSGPTDYARSARGPTGRDAESPVGDNE